MTSNNETRILVVDDEQPVSMIIGRVLSDEGFQVSLASNGQEALDCLRASRFDLLLTDIYMPVLRGDELMQRALEHDPEMAVLLITAIDDTSCAIDCLKAGAYDFLLKPFDLEDVLIRVKKALQRRNLERENKQYKQYLEERISETTQQLRRTVQQALESLIYTLEAKDPFTQNHSIRVADMSAEIARRMRPTDTRLHAQVRIAATFHDIGKIGIPEQVIQKPGKLTQDEMDVIKRLPEIGSMILAPMLDSEIVKIVRGHHESWDGTGYPDRLAGEEIPLGARIIAVADAYDAMNSERPHRPPLSPPRILEILHEGAGSQWDRDVVYVFLKLASSGFLEGLAPSSNGVSKAAELSAEMIGKDQLALVAQQIPTQEDTPQPIRGSRRVLGVGEHLDAEAARDLRQQIEALVYGEIGEQIVLDLSRCTDTDDQALHSIYSLDLITRRAGRRLVLRDISEGLAQRLHDAGLDGGMLFEQSLRLAAQCPPAPSNGGF
ncbi:MAG: response regulator [Armatimonas sp.]